MNRGFKVLIAAQAVLLATSAGAQEARSSDQVERGPPPSWVSPPQLLDVPAKPSGLAFVRDQQVLVHLDAQGKSTYFGQRIVLLQPQALQFGNIAISWNPASGQPTVHAVRIHRGTETIDVLDGTSFEVLRREDQLEQAMLSGILTAVLKVPDLRVGDELEFAYTMPSADPTLRDANFDIVGLDGTTLPGRYQLRVSWEKGAGPQIRATDDFAAPVIRTSNALEVRVDNPPTLSPPRDAPPRYAWQRIIELTDFKTWGALSKSLVGLYSDAARIAPGSPLEQEAARIAAANPGDLARAQAALALVQQQVRYIYVGLNGGNLRPANADETWQRRYGDCKGKTALLMALLDRLGIRSEAVLVTNNGSDDGLDARLPSPALFDHVVVRATIGGRKYWLDGTLPVVATASLTPDFPYRWVLPLNVGGSQALERLAWSPATVPNNLYLYEIDARDGFDAPARKINTTIQRGPGALLQYLQLSAISEEQLLDSFRNELAGSENWNTVETVKYRFDQDHRAGIIEIVGTGPVDWDDDGNGKRSMSLPGGGFFPPSRRQRAATPAVDAPFYDAPVFNCHVATVRLPSDTRPENWSHNSAFDTLIYGGLYYRAFERRDATIRMVRGSRTEQAEIDSHQAERDNVRLPRFDNSMAWVYYTPGKVVTLEDVQPGVPATFEGDWLTKPDACLPVELRP